MALIIRDLAAVDRPQWKPLWQGYLVFYETSLPDDVSDLTFQRLLDPAEPMFCLVAEQDGAVIGIVHCVVLEDLFVDPSARKSGAGRALIEAVYARADSIGATRVYWLTHETNTTARALYDKVATNAGFIQYRR